MPLNYSRRGAEPHSELLRPLRVFARGALALLALGACAPDDGKAAAPPLAAAAALAVTDDGGTTVRLVRPARRIVSLVPSATETLVAIGAAGQVVGVTRYDDIAAVSEVARVGGGLDPSLEQIAALQPDLVIAWQEAKAPELRQQLGRLDIPVFGIATQDTADAFAALERLGALAGRDSAAAAVAAAIRSRLAAVAAAVPAGSRPTAFYVVGTDPLMTAGPGSFISELLHIAGAETIFPDLAADWPQVSMEAVVQRDPDLMVWPVDEGLPPAERRRAIDAALTGPGWRQLRAVRCNRIVTVDRALLNRPGPHMGEAAAALRAALQSVPRASCPG